VSVKSVFKLAKSAQGRVKKTKDIYFGRPNSGNEKKGAQLVATPLHYLPHRKNAFLKMANGNKDQIER